MEITEAAVQQFKKMMADSDSKSVGIRIYTTGGGCCGPSYGLDITEQAEANDQVITKNDLKIFVDPEAYQSLINATIDFSTSGKKGFVIKGISSSCCG
jgi:iron-sulfur cluster insertion protein